MGANWNDVKEGMEIPMIKKNCSTQQLVNGALDFVNLGADPLNQDSSSTHLLWYPRQSASSSSSVLDLDGALRAHGFSGKVTVSLPISTAFSHATALLLRRPLTQRFLMACV